MAFQCQTFNVTTIFYSKYLHTTNICSNFVLSEENNENMKQKKEMMEVTPEERELLERMRNYN